LLGVEGLALGVVCGSLGHVLVQLWSVRRIGFRYRPAIDTTDAEARTALRLMAPRAVGLGAGQITFVVVTSLASLLGAGAITAFNVAFTLLQIPIGVIGVPLGTVVFPSLSREVAIGNDVQYVALLTRALRLLVYAMVPVAALMAILRTPIVEVLFPAFDARAIEQTTSTLLAFLAGAPAHALIAVLARAFYARQDTVTPVGAAILAVVINSTLANVFVGPFGLAGLGLAIAIAAWIEAGVLVALLARRTPGFGVAGIARVGIEAALAAALAGAAAVVVMNAIAGVIGGSPGRLALVAEGTAVAAGFGAVYLVASLALRIPELPTIVAVMADLVRRGAARRS
jgi:putative peptidoglycan lipid II flippase